MAPARLAPLALGVALDHVLDHQRDVTADAARAEKSRRPPMAQTGTIKRERDDDAVQAADGVGDGAEEHRPGEAPEDERVDAEHGEADGAHLGRRGGGEREEDADGQRRHRGLRPGTAGSPQPELGHVEREDEEPAVGGDADAGDDERPLRGAAEVAVAEH